MLCIFIFIITFFDKKYQIEFVSLFYSSSQDEQIIK